MSKGMDSCKSSCTFHTDSYCVGTADTANCFLSYTSRCKLS